VIHWKRGKYLNLKYVFTCFSSKHTEPRPSQQSSALGSCNTTPSLPSLSQTIPLVVQSLKPVYLFAFCVPTTTIVFPGYACNTLFVNVPAVAIYTINRTLFFSLAFLFKYSTPSALTVSEIYRVRYSLAILSTATTSASFVAAYKSKYAFPAAISTTPSAPSLASGILCRATRTWSTTQPKWWQKTGRIGCVNFAFARCAYDGSGRSPKKKSIGMNAPRGLGTD
jgi:hypothetical protein